jgi:hypothetical protein
MQSTPQQEYRIAPDLRRACWYAIIGSMLLAIVFFWISAFIQNRGPGYIAIGFVPFVLLTGAMVVALRWKLRVDQHGLARRKLFGWDNWEWAVFATGRVRKMHPHTLYDPDRPWGRRKLGLSYMASAEVQEVMSVINRHYRLPPPPEVPATLTIKYGFRRSAIFNHDGIHLTIGGRSHVYTWRDLGNIHVTRMDPVRRDFTSLLINLPNQDIELKLVTHEGGASPTWRGATAEEINEYLFHNVPSEKIHTSIAGDLPTNREHLEKELHRLEKLRRDLVLMLAVFTLLMTAVLVWMTIAVESGGNVSAAMAAMYVIFVGPTFAVVFRLHTKQIEDLKKTLESVSATKKRTIG